MGPSRSANPCCSLYFKPIVDYCVVCNLIDVSIQAYTIVGLVIFTGGMYSLIRMWWIWIREMKYRKRELNTKIKKLEEVRIKYGTAYVDLLPEVKKKHHNHTKPPQSV